MKLHKTTRRHSGFTLLELLVVLAIISMLAALVGPAVIEKLGKAKVDAAKAQISDLSQTLDMYKLDVGRYPTSDQGLAALVENPGDVQRWNGPYLRKNKVPLDPWNNEYKYTSPGEHGKYDISSLGADGKEGGEDEDKDINSWE